MRTHAVVAILLGSTGLASAEYWHLSLGNAQLSGTADMKAVTAALKASSEKLERCYTPSLDADPNTAVTVTVTFTIGGDGKVSAVKAKGLPDGDNACIAKIVSKLKLAGAKDGKPATITYPITFHPPNEVQGGAFASLTATGDVSSGFDDTNIYGGLLGDEAGEMNGGFGYGRPGFGPGGGGTGWGTIGTGRYGTIGHGSGGSGTGYGGGRGGMRGRYAAVPTVSIGQPNVQGDLDKAIVRRYIKRNIQKIQYCYEKQLLQKPKIAGTVATEFTISAKGTVSASKASGVDPEVASCVADVIKGIEFPKPKTGEVVVNYPLTFRPAADPAKP